MKGGAPGLRSLPRTPHLVTLPAPKLPAPPSRTGPPSPPFLARSTVPSLGLLWDQKHRVWLFEPLSVSAPRAYLCLRTLVQKLRSTPCLG